MAEDVSVTNDTEAEDVTDVEFETNGCVASSQKQTGTYSQL